MTQVTFGNGFTVSDDDNDDHGLAGQGGYGYTTLLLLAFQAFIADVQDALAAATDAEAAAATAVNAPGTSATSTTSLTIGTGSKSLTLAQTGKAFAVGQDVVIARTSAPVNRMIGVITAFNSGTGAMTVNVTDVEGSGGPFTDWTVALTGPSGGGSSVPITTEVTGTGLASGGGPLSGNVAIDVSAATPSEIRAGTSDSTAVAPDALLDAMAPVAVGYTATVTLDLSTGFKWTIGQLTGNLSLANPSAGLDPGRPVTIRLRADGTSRTVSFGSYWKRPYGSATTLTVQANGKVTISGEVVSATEIEITDVRFA